MKKIFFIVLYTTLSLHAMDIESDSGTDTEPDSTMQLYPTEAPLPDEALIAQLLTQLDPEKKAPAQKQKLSRSTKSSPREYCVLCPRKKQPLGGYIPLGLRYHNET